MLSNKVFFFFFLRFGWSLFSSSPKICSKIRFLRRGLSDCSTLGLGSTSASCDAVLAALLALALAAATATTTEGGSQPGLSLWVLTPTLIIAAIVGDAVNFAIGARVFLSVPTLEPMAAMIAWRKGSAFGAQLLRPMHKSVFEMLADRYG